MAPSRTRLDTGIGMLGDVPDLILRDGRVTEDVAMLLSSRLRELVRKTNRDISLGSGIDGYRSGNLDGQFIDVATTPSVADTEFPIIHGLDRVPVGYFVVRSDKAARVYDSSVGSWTSGLMFLKCDVASVSIKLLVF